MDYMDCEVFPDPCKGDPLGGIKGEERMVRLRELVHRICEFLKSGDGLSAVPTKPRFDLGGSSSFDFAVNAAETQAKTGLPGVTRVDVRHASNGEAFKSVFTDHILHFEPLHPLITVGFNVLDEWPEDSGNLPFFRKLAELMGTNDLVFGYSVDWDPYASMPSDNPDPAP